MKRKYISVLVIIVLTAFSGCKESFLDTEQQGVIPIDEFYQTEEEIFQGVMGCYDGWQQVFQGNSWYVATAMLMSGDVYAGGSGRGDNFIMEQICEFRYGPDNPYIAQLFTNLYAGIYRTNVMLEKIEPTDANRRYIAEVKALRAYLYFELVVGWGDVPLVLKTLKPSEYAQPRAPKSEVWAQIEKDLTEAIPDLPKKSQVSTADKARMTEGAAQSILGKVYLFQEKFAEAAAEFEKVITSEEYDLYPDFSQILKIPSEHGIESVLEVSLPSNMMNTRSNRVEYTVLFAWLGAKGAGYFDPSPELNLWNQGWGFAPAKASTWELFTEEGDIVRRQGTVLNEEEVIALGADLRNPAFGNSLAWATEGYLRLKYNSWISETLESEPYTNYGTNTRVIRFADVLLMAAEANNRKSSPDDAKARQYINRVRARVDLDPIDDSLTGIALFERIKTERHLELMFEGKRFQDLIRWGDADDVLEDHSKQIPRGDGTWLEVPDAGFKERNWLFPFPTREMTTNPNITENNPGY